MIRPATLFCALIAAGAGLFLYAKKHDTLVLDQSITQTVQETRRVQGQTAMLRTQWALLNQPDRLSALSKRVLPQLRMVEPSQFVRLAKLTDHLPAISNHVVPLAPSRANDARPKLTALHDEPNRPKDVSVHLAERHHSTHARPSHNASSLERQLALLNAADQPPAPRHHRHSGGTGVAADKDTHARATPSVRSAPSAETVAWHPQAARHNAPPHHDAPHSSSPQDALPPPVPISSQ